MEQVAAVQKRSNHQTGASPWPSFMCFSVFEHFSSFSSPLNFQRNNPKEDAKRRSIPVRCPLVLALRRHCVPLQGEALGVAPRQLGQEGAE